MFEEGAGAGDDDDDVEVVHEQAPVAVGPNVGGEKGVLVKDILEAQKNLKVKTLMLCRQRGFLCHCLCQCGF